MSQQFLTVNRYLDKNEKEIYEGDIVHVESDGRAWSVHYEDYLARFQVYDQINSNRDIEIDIISGHYNNPVFSIRGNDSIPLMVVGDIHYNTELLKKESG